MSARARAHSQRLLASWGNSEVTKKLVQRFGDRVYEGPFAGTILTRMSHAEQVGPCLLGVYESELDEAWSEVFRGTYTRIVDIGAKFGYYAVGLARKYPNAQVIAFDTDWWARKAVAEMAAANGTVNVEIKGLCSPDWLAEHGGGATLVVSDCEGFEASLFIPGVVARLRTATLLIETHDDVVAGATDTLRATLGDTHTVVLYGSGGARRETTRRLDFLTAAERQLAVQEVRPPQTWLLCLPKTGPPRPRGGFQGRSDVQGVGPSYPGASACRLLGVQGNHGVDTRRPTRGDEAGND